MFLIFFSIYKENVFKNKWFNLYFIIIILILSELISVDNYNLGIFNYNLVEFVNIHIGEKESQIKRIILFSFCALSFAFALLWEFLLYYINSNEYKKINKKKEPERKGKGKVKLKKFKTHIEKKKSHSLFQSINKINDN